MLGDRLKLARKKRGFSMDKLVEETENIVSKQALSKYERNLMVPGTEVLLALAKALDSSMEYLLSDRVSELTHVDYRKVHRTSAKERARVEATVLEHMERYLMIEEILELPSSRWVKPLLSDSMNNLDDVELLANKLRKHWELGNNPIPDMTALLEEHGIKVLMLALPNNVSGLTCFVNCAGGDEPFPIVIVNEIHSLERRRFTLAHELAHRLFDGEYSGDEEKAANRFAGCFLMNKKHLKKTAGPKRARIAYEEIVRLKHIYQVSASALVVRLEQIGAISKAVLSTIFQTIGKSWRSSEPEELEPARGSMEKPDRFRRLTLQALVEEYISIAKAMELLQLSPKQIKEALNGPNISHC